MRIIKKKYCNKCKREVELNCIHTPTWDKISCACSKCGNPIDVTLDDVMPQWRKILSGNTSIVKENLK